MPLYTLDRILAEKKKFAAGILLLALLSFAFIQIERSQHKEKTSADAYFLKATFDQTDGLREGSKVKLAGMDIGIVVNLALRPDDNYSSKVTLSIRRDIEIPKDSSASVQTNGLFGEKYISIDIGGEDEFLKNNDEFYYSHSSLLLDDLIDKVIVMARENQHKMVEKMAEKQVEQMINGAYDKKKGKK